MQRTRKQLREALFSLIHEKSYDAIVVKEILHRANVGRSTFYSHYRDKDELLVSEMREFLRSVHSAEPSPDEAPQERMVRWSLPLFDHISRHQQAATSRTVAPGQPTVHGYLQEMLAELVAEEVRSRLARWGGPVGRLPPELVARQVASTFILVLDWSVDGGGRLSPQEADRAFRALVLPTLTAAV